MIIHVHKWVLRLKWLTAFLILVCIVYLVLRLFASWIEPDAPDRKPGSGAVKAVGQPHTEGRFSPGERLKLFYWYGE